MRGAIVEIRGIYNKVIRLFKKKKVAQCQSLVCLNDLIDMPKKDDFAEDAKALELIDGYKEEYLKTLKKDRTILSVDLMPKELQEYKNIYLDLTVSLCLDDESGISFDIVDDVKAGSEKLESMIKRIKLDLYLSEVRALEKETRLRLVALNELFMSGIFPRNKMVPAANEINNLVFALVVFMSQQSSMEKSKDNYLIQVKNLVTLELEASNEEELDSERLQELKRLMALIMPDRLKELEEKDLNPKLFIAKIEQILEIYVYTHLDYLEQLAFQVDGLEGDLNRKRTAIINDDGDIGFIDNKILVKQAQDKYLELVERIESLYKIFSVFGRNKVSKSDIKKLYEVKFRILTLNILERDIDIMSKITYTELEVYQDILYRKLENIAQGENDYIAYFARTHNMDEAKAIKTIINIFRDENNLLDAKRILSNRILLAFLLTLENDDNLTVFFQDLLVSKDMCKELDFFDEMFGWNDYLPLSSIYFIAECNIAIFKDKTFGIKDALYDFYQMFSNRNTISNNYFFFPEGLNKIDGYRVISSVDSDAITYISELVDKKTIVMPKSMRVIRSMQLYNQGELGMVLNEGLESLDEYALSNFNVSTLNFPSTLIEISNSAVNFRDLKRIYVDDYLNNPSLERIVRLIIDNCITFEKTDMQRRISISYPYTSMIYSSGSVVNNYNSIMDRMLYTFKTEQNYVTDKNFDIYEVTFTFDNLVFRSLNDDYLVFSKKSLTYYLEVDIMAEELFEEMVFSILDEVFKPYILNAIWEKLGLAERFNAPKRILEKNTSNSIKDEG